MSDLERLVDDFGVRVVEPFIHGFLCFFGFTEEQAWDAIDALDTWLNCKE